MVNTFNLPMSFGRLKVFTDLKKKRKMSVCGEAAHTHFTRSS
jgi:hypothetical protein